MPNWYLKQKMKNLAPALLLGPLGLGLGPKGDDKHQQPPAPVVQPAQPAQPAKHPAKLTTQPSTTQPSTTQPSATQPSTPTELPKEPAKPDPKPIAPQAQSVSIDVNKIIQIESNGHRKATNSSGAAGLMQIMPATWEEIANKIGQFKGFQKYKFNRKANVTIGTYYMNKEIPRLLKSFNLPDDVDMRLAAYNYGVGNVKKVYESYGEDWKLHLPQETADYLKKYHN
jgi:hypothetical protein